MAHIKLPDGIPGIVGPMMAYPATSKPLNELAEVLLNQESPGFSKADRETIASYVSYLNECIFCSETHGAAADVHWGEKGKARLVWTKDNWSKLTPKLQSLLEISAKVQKDARTVSTTDVENARVNGATDRDIHDTVLIAASFCMYNRYVDGLATMAPPRKDPAYEKMGKDLTITGYRKAIPGQ